MRWNKREILLAEEWEKDLFNENQSVVFTHKPNCLSERYVVFEMKKKKKRIRKLSTGTYLLHFVKLFSLIPPLCKHICRGYEMQLFYSRRCVLQFGQFYDWPSQISLLSNRDG